MLFIGTDIIEIGRIKNAIEHWGDHFLNRVYTEQELARYRGKYHSLAARFAAKEAVFKALDMRQIGTSWQDIEILNEPGGKPFVTLYGNALLHSNRLGITRLNISISHSQDNAVVFVIGENQ